jgi:hypothetical protein
LNQYSTVQYSTVQYSTVSTLTSTSTIMAMAVAVMPVVNDAVAMEVAVNMAMVAAGNDDNVAVEVEGKLNADDFGGASSLIDEQDAEASEAQQLLTWRLDQFESHADWTVIIEHNNNNDNANDNENADMDINDMDMDDLMESQQEGQNSSNTYHVHKTMLGVGPYKSNYFGALFKHYSDSCCRYIVPEEYQLIETQDSTSILTVDSLAQAGAVPVLLDYIYSRGVVESFSTQNAVAVKSLSSYLGCGKLLQAVTEFIERDMSVKNCTYYLRSSASASHGDGDMSGPTADGDADADADTVLACHEEEVFQKATRLCAKSFEHLKRDDLFALSPTLFETVVLCPSLVCVGDELSCRVAEYCRESPHKDNSKQKLTSKWLASVTHPNHMPSIFPGEGLFLLNKAQELFTDAITATSTTLGGGEKEEEEKEVVEYKALQDRCIDAVSEYWSELLVLQSEESHTAASLENRKLFANLSSELKDRILQAATKVAQEEVDVLRKELLRVGGGRSKQTTMAVPVMQVANDNTANSNHSSCCTTATQLQMVLQSLILQISHLEEEVRVQRQRQRHAGRAKRRKQKQ